MTQNTIQNGELFSFQGGRADRILCNLQSSSTHERTGREERCAKIAYTLFWINKSRMLEERVS